MTETKYDKTKRHHSKIAIIVAVILTIISSYGWYWFWHLVMGFPLYWKFWGVLVFWVVCSFFMFLSGIWVIIRGDLDYWDKR